MSDLIHTGGAFNNASASSALKRFHSERGRLLRRSIAPASTVDRSFACISKMASGSGHINPFPKRRKSLQTTILNLMKMAEKFSKRLENVMGRYKQLLLFPKCFQTACTRKDFNYNIGVTGQTNITHTPFTVY